MIEIKERIEEKAESGEETIQHTWSLYTLAASVTLVEQYADVTAGAWSAAESNLFRCCYERSVNYFIQPFAMASIFPLNCSTCRKSWGCRILRSGDFSSVFTWNDRFRVVWCTVSFVPIEGKRLEDVGSYTRRYTNFLVPYGTKKCSQ